MVAFKRLLIPPPCLAPLTLGATGVAAVAVGAAATATGDALPAAAAAANAFREASPDVGNAWPRPPLATVPLPYLEVLRLPPVRGREEIPPLDLQKREALAEAVVPGDQVEPRREVHRQLGRRTDVLEVEVLNHWSGPFWRVSSPRHPQSPPRPRAR